MPVTKHSTGKHPAKPKSKESGLKWWMSLTAKQQKDYVAKHPTSKYAGKLGHLSTAVKGGTDAVRKKLAGGEAGIKKLGGRVKNAKAASKKWGSEIEGGKLALPGLERRAKKQFDHETEKQDKKQKYLKKA
jgi:hypothetical protein